MATSGFENGAIVTEPLLPAHCSKRGGNGHRGAAGIDPLFAVRLQHNPVNRVRCTPGAAL